MYDYVCMINENYLMLITSCVETSGGAGAQSVTVYVTGCGLDSALEKMKYLLKFIFSSLWWLVTAKRGVEFRHSTRDVSRILRKLGNGVSLTRFPLPILMCAGCSVKMIYLFIL